MGAAARDDVDVRHVQPYEASKPYRCPGCDHEIGPRGPHRGGSAAIQRDEAGTEHPVAQSVEEVEAQLLGGVRPPQRLRETDRLRGMAELVIREYPDGRRTALELSFSVT